VKEFMTFRDFQGRDPLLSGGTQIASGSSSKITHFLAKQAAGHAVETSFTTTLAAGQVAAEAASAAQSAFSAFSRSREKLKAAHDALMAASVRVASTYVI